MRKNLTRILLQRFLDFTKLAQTRRVVRFSPTKCRLILGVPRLTWRSTPERPVPQCPRTFTRLLSKYKLEEAVVTLYSYLGEKVPILGKITVPGKYDQNDMKRLDLVVVKGKRPTLFDRDWLDEIRVNWENVFSVSERVKLGPGVPR